VSHALLTALLTAVIGCGSKSPLKPDGGSAGSGGGGDKDAGSDSQSGGGGAAAAGGTGGSSASSCVPSGGGACGLCPNGYLTGPDGCATCHCKFGDGKTVGDSLGSATVRLVVPAGRSFCGCSGGLTFTVLDAAGQPVGTAYPWCSMMPCSTCTPTPCAVLPCVPEALPDGVERTWDGTAATTASTCGNHLSCERPAFAPAGRYIARLCATPGDVTTVDGGFWDTCTATGPMECVDVPFDFPASSPVIGTLP
jgi:hypothetical protein